jgi:hypothetical protein
MLTFYARRIVMQRRQKWKPAPKQSERSMLNMIRQIDEGAGTRIIDSIAKAQSLSASS